MTNDTIVPSGSSDHDQVDGKTNQLPARAVPFFLSQSTQVRQVGNTVSTVRQTRVSIVRGSTNGTEKPITEERLGQLKCNRCETACGFTGQPALTLHEKKFLCPNCISVLIRRANKKK